MTTADQLRTRRDAFRNGIMADVESMVYGILGAIRPPPRVVNAAFMLGSPGMPLSGSEQCLIRLGLNGPASIMSWSMAATVAGIPAIVTGSLDVQVGQSMAVLASICGGNFPSLAAQSEIDEQPPTGWTLTIPDPSWVFVRPHAVDGVAEVLGLTLRLAIGAYTPLQTVSDASGQTIVDNNGDIVTWGQ